VIPGCYTRGCHDAQSPMRVIIQACRLRVGIPRLVPSAFGSRDVERRRLAAAEHHIGRHERGALVIHNADGGCLEINNWRNREWAKAAEKAG
jgi:hypothetical protein